MRFIAHRGASAHAPENTLASFRAALELGAKAVEFDIQQTRDGRLVVIHDPSLGRLAGVRARVSELTFEQLKGLDVGRWFDARFEGERVPSLEEALGLLWGKVELHVEIKEGGHAHPGIEGRLLALLRAGGRLDGVRISSFDPPTLAELRRLDSDAKLGYLLGGASLKSFELALEEAARMRATSMDLSRRLASRERIQAARSRGLETLVYTVNDPADAAKLAAFGAEGVFTDHPELAKDYPLPQRGREEGEGAEPFQP